MKNWDTHSNRFHRHRHNRTRWFVRYHIRFDPWWKARSQPTVWDSVWIRKESKLRSQTATQQLLRWCYAAHRNWRDCQSIYDPIIVIKLVKRNGKTVRLSIRITLMRARNSITYYYYYHLYHCCCDAHLEARDTTGFLAPFIESTFYPSLTRKNRTA